MSAAELKELKEKVKKCIDEADEQTVKMVYEMLANTENESVSYFLTPEQEAILDERMKLDEQGLMKYSTWEEAKKRILHETKSK